MKIDEKQVYYTLKNLVLWARTLYYGLIEAPGGPVFCEPGNAVGWTLIKKRC